MKTCKLNGMVFAMATIIGIALTACDNGNTHNHTHDWQWVTTTPATEEADGEETEKCSICGETRGTRPIPKLPPPPNNDGKMVYLGLKDEANVRTAQTSLRVKYWPKTQIIDNFLYVPTINGIYRKDLTALNNIDWELYAFEGMPISDFIKNEETVLAATALLSDKNVLLLSTDDGLTYIDYTHRYFIDLYGSMSYGKCIILRLAQNPHNRNIIMALHDGNPGVSLSADFGIGWELLNTTIGGYQDRFIDFNPHDVTNVFHTGETEFYQSFINATYDSGVTWATVDAFDSNCSHGIAFHPSNKNIMVAYGEGRITKSTDQGRTWTTTGNIPLYVYKVIYDRNNPNILYASGGYREMGEVIDIYRSTDGGDSWHIFYEEAIENFDGVMDIHLYNNKLIIYTLINGVYYLNLAQNES